jgi:hypothetical protein
MHQFFLNELMKTLQKRTSDRFTKKKMKQTKSKKQTT